MDDGIVLRADVYRPLGEGKFPGLMTHGPYAKGLSFQDGYALAWNQLARDRPDALVGSSNTYQAWEPPILPNVRHPNEKFVPRRENEWPLARTQWTQAADLRYAHIFFRA